MRLTILCLLVFLFVSVSVLLPVFPLEAAEKNWAGSGDASTWSDDDNWSPQVTPTSADDVLIDAEGASVTCTETFKAKSITISGRETSSLTSNNFVFGTISPASPSDMAILIRSGGTLTLKGAGVVTVKGQYKDSEETLNPEPSFMFWVK